MATKKNPLAALLSTDERQQVQELQRDHVLRSAARQAGTYGVGVQKPLPISQTNLGRLSNSLGTVSGILAQFTAYQAQKEQVELKGQGLQHTLNMQELQSLEADLNTKGALIQKGTAHEVVKKQAIQLEQAQEAAANAEFDVMVRDSNKEQRIDLFRRAQEQVRITRERAERARLGQPLDPYSPEFRDRSLRIIGSLRGADFADYLEAETQKALVELRKNDNGASLTREEAMDLSEDIRERYMKLKELSLDDEIGRGFMNATERLRAAREPELANQLLKQSESINTENLIGAVKQWAESEPDWENLERQEWYAQMTGMDKYRFLGAFMGTQGNPQLGTVGTPGVKGLMTQTHKGALQFQQLFNRVSEKYQLEGKPLKEYSGFDAMQASVEEAVENTLTRENRQKENLFSDALNGARSYLHNMDTQLTDSQVSAKSVGLVQEGDYANPSALRKRIQDRFPGLNIDSVPDDRLPEFAMALVTQLQGIGDIKTKQTANLVTTALGPNAVFLDSKDGLTALAVRLKGKIDGFPGADTISFTPFFKGILEGGPSTGFIGLQEQGGSIYINKLDAISDGALSGYREKLNNLKGVVEAELPENATSDQFYELYRTKYRELEKETEQLVGESIVRHVEEQKAVLGVMNGKADARAKAILELSKKPEYEGLERGLTVDPAEFKTFQEANRDYTPQEVIDVLLERGKTIEAPLGETLRFIYADTPETADQYFKNFDASRKQTLEEANLFNEGGQFFLEHRNNATSLASGGYPYLFGKEVVRNYTQSSIDVNRANTKRLTVAIDGAEAKELGELLAYNKGKSQPNKPLVVIPAEDYVNVLPKGAKPPKDTYVTDFGIPSVGPELAGIGGGATSLRSFRTVEAPEYLQRKLKSYGTTLKEVDVSGAGFNSGGSFMSGGGLARIGEPDYHDDWPRIRRDTTIPAVFFGKVQTPLLGIPFDTVTDNKLPKQSDVKDIRLGLQYTPKELKQVSALFGFDTELEFLQSQYNNSYYYNKRVK